MKPKGNTRLLQEADTKYWPAPQGLNLGFRSCRRTLRQLAFALFLFGVLVSGRTSETSTNRTRVLIVCGAPGEAEYGSRFEAWTHGWEAGARKGNAIVTTLGLEPGKTNDLQTFKEALAAEPVETGEDLWIVLIGHGTFDSKDAKFNLRGPDLAASELTTLLKPFKRPLAIINAFSSSGPFLKQLTTPGRVIITATRSGAEQNFCRLGEYLSETITDAEADLDKDGQTSLLEAFLLASRRVSDWYKGEGRLVTEHPLLDDNGDGFGTPPDWFRGVQATKKAASGASLDGLRAHQRHLVRSAGEEKLSAPDRARRDELEGAIAELRDQKQTLPEAEYYNRLEKICFELAEIYARADKP
jgi:hypothetical protein